MENLSYRQQVLDYIKQKFDCKPEYPWYRYPNYAVARHSLNNKWFLIVMDVPYSKFNLEKHGITDILNIKVNNLSLKDFLLHQNGFFKAYHMGRDTKWISVLLDGTVSVETIYNLIDESYENTLTKSKLKTNKK